jgi:hypothetical protein
MYPLCCHTQPGQAQTAGALAPCRLWYTGIGRLRSCGDKHYPRCLAAKSRQWLEKQTQSLLPIAYFHCVFTLPAELNGLMLVNPRRLYPLLFESAARSLLEFGHTRLHGDLGITAVLHTWGQKLDFHPHLHCIVTAGAPSPDGKQWHSPKQRKFLFPVRALASLFRGKFLVQLAPMLKAGVLDQPDSQFIKLPTAPAGSLCSTPGPGSFTPNAPLADRSRSYATWLTTLTALR